MDVLYYYEYLLMQKFKEGVILIEEPLKYRSDVYSDVEKDSEQSSRPSEKQNRTPNLTLLIILVKKKEEKKIDKKLACCHLQLACQWYKYNKAVLAKYDYFSNDETIIVYSKTDFKVKYKRISSELWFLDNALKQHPKRLLLFLNSELKSQREPQIFNETLFSHYVHQNSIMEMHLDSIFQHREMVLPSELFRCTNVKILSLKHNFMTNLPADIGRMCNLEHLILTNNLLTVKSIPQTLKFCSQLTHLYLDNNHFDALPGFLLDMHHLKSVRRHGNHNYFKSTFIWYHHELNERVLKVNEEKKVMATIFQPPSLELIAIQSVISSKENFFRPGYLPDTLQDYISHVFTQFNICGHCSAARPLTDLGYKVFTFKSPYCGNTCVPFQHWACSRECGDAIEVPARLAQQRATRLMDELYEQYITAVERDSKNVTSDKAQCILL